MLREQESVEDLVVLAREDVPGTKRLVAYVVGESLNVTELRDHLKVKLPEYMVPSAFVVLEALPRTPNGKLDRKALPAPDGSVLERTGEYAAARNGSEEALCEIWRDVLRLDQVGIHDNFFELGGDSILCIQVVARARRVGLTITPKQLFQHQTIAELAAVADTAQTVQAEQGTISGNVPLTPIQRWFFEHHAVDTHHFNQARLLELRKPVDSESLKAHFIRLVEHHDALRLRFAETRSGWQQTNAAKEDNDFFSDFDLAGLTEAEQNTALEAESAKLQAGLNLENGPILRVGYFDLGASRPHRLLIVIHHLAIDGVSWRIVLEDLAALMQAASLPPKTTSYRDWSRRLQAADVQEEAANEIDYWLSVQQHSETGLPVDHAGENTVASAQNVIVRLTADETKALLQKAPAAFQTHINDVLLTALAQAILPWSGQETLFVDLEAHGRADRFEDIDLTRTVGWFTNIYPVSLRLAEGDLSDSLRAVRDCLREIPNNGFGYDLLRYGGDTKAASTLRPLAHPQIAFNYLGQFGATFQDDSPFQPADGAIGPVHSERQPRHHLWEISSSVARNELVVRWRYSEAIHDRATIERLANDYIASLRAIVAEAREPKARRQHPSDFPKAKLDQKTLDAAGAIEDAYGLSPLQQGILFHALYAPEEGVYHEQLLFTLDPTFDLAALENAWRHVVDSHTILRTTFHWQSLDEPVQVVHPAVQVEIERHEWSADNLHDYQEKLIGFLAADRKRPFDLSKAPLFRLSLIDTGTAPSYLCWSFHHIALDRWSVSLVLEEVLKAYEAICKGETPVPPAAIPYGRYIEWIKKQDALKAEEFWRASLKGFTAPTPLPAAKNTGSLYSGEDVRMERVELTKELSDSLRTFCRSHQLTVNTVMQAAWALILSAYSASGDVLFGGVVSGRPPALQGVDAMVGLFINTLPVRTQIPTEAPVIGWLKDLQQQIVEVREYEHSSLLQVQGWSDIPRGVPLFESLVITQNTPRPQGGRGKKPVLTLRNVDRVSRDGYPLTIVVAPDQQMRIVVNYDTERFEQAAVQRVLAQMQMLLSAIVAGAQKPVASLSLLSESERSQLLVDWNATYVDYPSERCVHQLFEDQAAKTPDRIAVSFQDRELSYAELNSRANQLAHYLKKQGVGPETLVGLCVERSPEMVVGLLGVLKAGGAYVPLDPSYPAERLAYMLRDSRAPVLLTLRHLADRVEAGSARVVYLDAPGILENMPTENPVSGALPESLAYVIYTSGSTGRPKGAMIRHQGLTNYLSWASHAYRAREGIGAPVHSPLSFDLTVTSLLPALISGATAWLAPEGEGVETLAHALQARRNYSLVKITPAHLELLNTQLSPEEASGATRAFVIGGEALYPEQIAFWRKHAPKTRLINEYGPTETVVGCCVYECGVEDSERWPGGLPIGRPIANTQLYVLDPRMQPLPVGVVGELYIGGHGVARGYIGRPDITAERFVPDPFSGKHGARLYRTGDLCRYHPDGALEYLGRIDNQVKVRGFRIELGEIEGVLLEHASIKEAAVVVREEAAGKRLVAYVAGDGTPDIAALRDHLRAKLPEHMVPPAFVVLESLPLTPNGKVDRKALPALEGAISGTGEYVAPRNQMEEQVAGIFAQILGVEKVGVHDSFFDLGGHSLLAVRLVNEISRICGHSLPLRALFRASTVESIVHELGAEQDAPAPSAVIVDTVFPIQPGSSAIPVFCIAAPDVNALGYVALGRHLGPSQPLFVLNARFRSNRDRPYTRQELREMASSNLEALRKIQAHGPYCLGGMCEGAHIAFEMGRMLREMGEEVPLLISFDAWPEENTRSWFKLWLWYLKRFGAHFGYRAKEKTIRILGITWVAFTEWALVPIRRPAPHRWAARYWPGRNFVPEKFDGKITVLRVGKQESFRIDRHDLGWADWATEGVAVYDVPGEHSTILRDENVPQVAAILRSALDTVAGPTHPSVAERAGLEAKV
ncbi:MAG TPA: amino acid adenylation domain-containing protein [Capsulimonadaceae bacterium]|nr:amino acid adenylation domain-containing protein [Capsulimonadaceae bacterium]